MSVYLRRKVRLFPGLWLNLSKTGGSVSAKKGPVTVNTRGRVTVRLGRGLYWRSR